MVSSCSSTLESGKLGTEPQQAGDTRFTVEARFYEKLANQRILCTLCPRECKLRDGQRGYCGVRENRGGVCYTLVHSRVCTAHVDPVEKKPLFHYMPGSMTFSVATVGCNVHCRFCQNWEISQARPEHVAAEFMPPREVVRRAVDFGCPTIAFTYGEPVIFSEFLMDTADAGHAAGLRSIVVSNGFIRQEALRAAYGKMDAVKIDLKAFSDAYYRNVVGGELGPVLRTLVTLRETGKWLEIVYLVTPGLNDSDTELRELSRWVKSNLGVEVPLHFSRFHPDYLLRHLSATPVATLERARELALAEGLHFVYVGNVPGHRGENTYCPKCGRMLVERSGFAVQQMLIRKGACLFCRQPIPGMWGS